MKQLMTMLMLVLAVGMVSHIVVAKEGQTGSVKTNGTERTLGSTDGNDSSVGTGDGDHTGTQEGGHASQR